MEYSPLIFAETDEGVRIVQDMLPDELDALVIKGGNMSSSISYASSCALANPRTVIVIIETISEEDRFFKNWLQDQRSLSTIRPDSQLHIIGAAPNLAEAVQDPDWIERVVAAATCDSDHRDRMRR